MRRPESKTRKPNKHRKAATLNPTLDKNLLAYLAATSAAGVSVLALAQPAGAKIIYTPAHKNIEPNTTTHLDLNHDGIVDFSFKDVHSSSSVGGGIGRLTVLPAHDGNQIWGHSVSGQAYASALLRGVRIGPKKHFIFRTGMMASTAVDGGQIRTSGVCTNPWANVSNRYLGVKFAIKGELHFGWARLNVSCPRYSDRVTATLTGYAYETVPNRPIDTGQKTGSEEVPHIVEQNRSGAVEPATLGHLAQGAQGLVAWRREREDAGA